MTRRTELLCLLLLLGCGGNGVRESREREAFEIFRKGMSATKSGDHEAAIRFFTDAAELSPTFYQAYEFRAKAYEKLGKNDEALADYGHAIRVATEVEKARIHCKRGLFLHRLGRNGEAEKDFSAAVERLKEWPDPRYYIDYYEFRAIFYLDTGQLDKCIKDCDHVLSLNPDEGTRRIFETIRQDAYDKKSSPED